MNLLRLIDITDIVPHFSLDFCLYWPHFFVVFSNSPVIFLMVILFETSSQICIFWLDIVIVLVFFIGELIFKGIPFWFWFHLFILSGCSVSVLGMDTGIIDQLLIYLDSVILWDFVNGLSVFWICVINAEIMLLTSNHSLLGVSCRVWAFLMVTVEARRLALILSQLSCSILIRNTDWCFNSRSLLSFLSKYFTLSRILYILSIDCLWIYSRLSKLVA